MKFIVTFGGGGAQAGYGSGGADASRGLLAGQIVPVLARLGEVVTLDHPAQGVAQAARSRAAAVHLCFALPNELPDEAGAETYAVFGLGLASCPDPARDGPGPDWHARLRRCGGAVCFSSHAASAVRGLMGEAYPVLVVPPALDCAASPAPPAACLMSVTGAVLDTALWPETGPPDVPPAAAEDEDAPWPDPIDTAAPPPAPAWKKTARYRLGVTRLHLVQAYREGVRDLLPPAVAGVLSRTARTGTRAARRLLAAREAGGPPTMALPGGQTAQGECSAAPGGAWQTGRIPVRLSGPVFAAVHGAWDRGWSDLLSGFVLTCRDDASVTLVIKTAALDEGARGGLAGYLRRLGPFACRVVILDGAIEGGLDRLVRASLFYLCASPGEAAPLPMMRFLAAGRPAVSPVHSALADLVTRETGFPVESSIEYETWPGDADERLGATAWRLDWGTLCGGIAQACALARRPADYAARARATSRHMQDFCGPEAVLAAVSALQPALADADAQAGPPARREAAA